RAHIELRIQNVIERTWKIRELWIRWLAYTVRGQRRIEVDRGNEVADPHAVIVEAHREPLPGVEHDAEIELARFLGLQRGIASADDANVRIAVLGRMRHRAAQGVVHVRCESFFDRRQEKIEERRGAE